MNAYKMGSNLQSMNGVEEGKGFENLTKKLSRD